MTDLPNVRIRREHDGDITLHQQPYVKSLIQRYLPNGWVSTFGGAQDLSRDQKSCQRSRHLERKYLKIRELIAAGEIEVRHIDATQNPADLFTKSTLDNTTFERHSSTVMGSA